MKWVTYQRGDGQSVGVVDAEGNICAVTGQMGFDGDMNAVIAAGEDFHRSVADALAQGQLPTVDGGWLVAPVPNPIRDIFCAGKNYHEHAHEFHGSGFDNKGSAVPEHAVIFTKATTSVIGPDAPIPATSDPTKSVDYEGELTIVIGKGGRGISKADALDHVFGYTIINDVTSREIQKRHSQWVLGKGMDGFCPMGPWLVTVDEAGALEDMTLETRVNGEVRQSAKVADLIFDVPTLIADISACITLVPGDLIATGTPAGVGLGFSPPKFLKAGDTVDITIGRLGTLSNPVS